jgi:hypothetical protein
MSRIVYSLIFAAFLAGRATSRPSAQLSAASRLEAIAQATIFQPDQLAEIPVGHFCRVHSTTPDTLHEGTIAPVSGDEIVLSNAAVVAPRTMGPFG